LGSNQNKNRDCVEAISKFCRRKIQRALIKKHSLKLQTCQKHRLEMIMKIMLPCLFFMLFATACSKVDSRSDDDVVRFSISASNVDAAVVTFVAGGNAANPAQMEPFVHVNLSTNGAADFTKFVQSHTNQPVKILVDKYENNVMFHGVFTNGLHEFDFQCASSNDAQMVVNILNRK
jgi:hypothetical protein